MSDPKRATLTTVGAPKSANNNVNKTVRFTINLEESTNCKYTEVNYKELVRAASKKRENGKTSGLDPFSDNDDDVMGVTKKFEQKYGGKSTYGRKGMSKYDEFADIGAGYDENDSFIDNTDGYDEQVPLECDTIYGGFYINSGSLEFQTVSKEPSRSDTDNNRRNKRRISSSSSEEESSDSSSESDSQDAKDPKAIANGAIHSHDTEHRKMKNKNIDKKKAKKIRRTDSSAATSGKQTSDDNGQGDAESADSRTSQSDSLTSKPAPSSENAITSDSSRDTESKVEVKLPSNISQILEEIQTVSRLPSDASGKADKTDRCVVRLEQALCEMSADKSIRRVSWSRAAKSLGVSRAALLQRARRLPHIAETPEAPPTTSQIAQATAITATASTTTTSTTNTTNATNTTNTSNTVLTSNANKRKADEDRDGDFSRLSPEEKEEKIVQTLQRLKVLIDERKPGMIATYNAECERVQEERKKIQIASADGAPHIMKRLPKRRFPWCPRTRALLLRLAALAGDPEAAAKLLATRALPLFPPDFVRMPTLLRQADLNKDIKAADLKRPRLGSASQSVITSTQQFTEPIQFPSSLTVTTSSKPAEKEEERDPKYKINPAAVLGNLINSYTLNKDLVIEPEERKKETERSKEDMYIPPNKLGSITITPVPSSQKTDKKVNSVNDKTKEPLLRVKSPAALNEMVQKKEKEKHKKPDKNPPNSKRVESPLHIETSFPNKKEPTPSPKLKDEISQKQIESMRIAENNIPRPGLVSVHHSPTFAKPDKRPPEVKKKKDIVIVSDLDPLGDIPHEPVPVDDSSSDVEILDETKSSENKSDTVPSKDSVNVNDSQKKVSVSKPRSDKSEKSVSAKDKEFRKEKIDETTDEDVLNVLRNITEMKHSQDPTKLNCNSHGSVITSEKSSLNNLDGGISTVTG